MAIGSPAPGIVITGASRGIGAALARQQARPGAHLLLIGRVAEDLEAVAADCRGRGGKAETALVDVTDTERLAAALTAFDARVPVGRVFANAGIAAGTRPDGEDEPAAVSIRQIRVNLEGAIATAQALLPAMKQRRHGQIVLISSIAGLHPLPDAPGYSASKAGLIAYGKALGQRLHGSGVSVMVVCPGFVATAMGRRFRGRRPFEMSAEETAKRILRGLERGRARLVFPLPLALAVMLARITPARVVREVMQFLRFRIYPHEDTR